MGTWVIWLTGMAISGAIGWQLGRSQSHASAVKHPSTPLTGTTPTAAATPVVDQPTDTDTDTEIQALQQQLQRTQVAYQMAQEMGQFKAGFLARSSHELRSPINSVISLHQLILSDLCEDAAEEREFVAQAYTAAQKMLSLLDELINVSKATQSAAQLDIQPICLEDVVMEVQSLTYLMAKNRNLQLEIEFPDPEVYVLADPKWLRQVLVSLVSAPMPLMQEGKIQLTTVVDQPNQQVHVQLEDQRPARFWYEPIDLMKALKEVAPVTDRKTALDAIQELTTQVEQLPPPGLSLLTNQAVLEMMGGRLEIVNVPEQAPSSMGQTADQAGEQSRQPVGEPVGEQVEGRSLKTCLRCSLPWVAPEDR